MRQFPKSMTERRQWITWTLTSDGKKIPNGKSNDPSTWTDYESIKDESRIAYVFHESDPFVGIDLDNCIDENGRYNQAAMDAFEMLGTSCYLERSQSEKGLHFIVGTITVPRKAYIYNNVVEGWSDECVSFRDCFGRHFDYAEVMADNFNLNAIKL